MGLKTTNFYIKRFDLALPTAYAKLRTLVLNSDGTVNSTFSIQQSRLHCEKYDAIDVVKVTSKTVWDRTIPLEKFAYDTAKTEIITQEVTNEETGEPTTAVELGTLYGWQDDIV